MVLTGTHLHTGSSEVELPIRVWFGLKGGRVIDGGRRTVLLTHTTVIEVTTSLQRGRTLIGPRKKKKKHKTKQNQDRSYVTYQTVRVFGSGASSSTLHVAAVIGKRAFASLAARCTVTTGHFEEKRQVQTFSCSLTKQSFCLQATGTHRSGSPVQLLPNSLSNTQRNSWGLQQQEKHNK